MLIVGARIAEFAERACLARDSGGDIADEPRIERRGESNRRRKDRRLLAAIGADAGGAIRKTQARNPKPRHAFEREGFGARQQGDLLVQQQALEQIFDAAFERQRVVAKICDAVTLVH